MTKSTSQEPINIEALRARIQAQRAKVFGAHGTVALVVEDILANSGPTDVDCTIGALEGARDALESAKDELDNLNSDLAEPARHRSGGAVPLPEPTESPVAADASAASPGPGELVLTRTELDDVYSRLGDVRCALELSNDSDSCDGTISGALNLAIRVLGEIENSLDPVAIGIRRAQDARAEHVS